MTHARISRALVALALAGALLLGAAHAQAPVKLRFVSLAWQPQAIDAEIGRASCRERVSDPV